MATMINVIGPDGKSVAISPVYNLRFFAPTLIEQTIKAAEESLTSAEAIEYMQSTGTSAEDIATAFAAIAAYMRACLDAQQKTPLEAAQKSGLLDTSDAAQRFALAELGRILLCSIWWPLREGTRVNEIPQDTMDLFHLGEMLRKKWQRQ